MSPIPPPPPGSAQRKPPQEVVIETVDGETQRGTVTRFDPTSPTVLLDLVTDSGDTQKVLVPSERIIYVGFLRGGGAEPFLAIGPVDLKLVCMRDLRLQLRISKEDADNPIGFFGATLDPDDPYKKVFCYASMIQKKENLASIGEMLVESGAVQPSDLDRGVEAQEQGRRVPLGHILVQQQAVTPEDVDRARNLQARRGLRIGEVLVEEKLASEDDITQALAQQKKSKGKRLGQVLIEMDIISERALYETLARKFFIPFVDLDEVAIDESLRDLVEDKVLTMHKMLPLEIDQNDVMSVAISDPTDTEGYDLIRFRVKKRIREILVMPTQLERYLAEGRGDKGEETEIGSILSDLHLEDIDFGRDQTSETVADSDSVVVRLVNQIIIDAQRKGASDIHIEPNGREAQTIVRFRIDGHCAVYQRIPPAFRNAVVARVKIMSELDISERRKPQDGKIVMRNDGKKTELRVATIPTVNGNEDVVMRILASSKPMPLEKMGFSDRNLRELKKVIVRPHGLILCVGPTGSGKTTTLHSILGAINQPKRKIWTAEDPVEITQKGLRQVQVKPKIGFNFAAAMRAFLRADPDVIMIGEMRDTETASIGVEASLTGHVVFSTLHTNSAPETITRLLDMGLDPFSFAEAIQGVLAQRLARGLCPRCRTVREATESEFDDIAEMYGPDAMRRRLGVVEASQLQVWEPGGCAVCNNKGYRGRVALHELLIAGDAIRDAILKRESASVIRDRALEEGMTTLLQDGIDKAVSGKTDLQQVLAVCNR